jgi:hypothetical protein
MTLNQQTQLIGERMSRYQKVRQEIGTVSYTIPAYDDPYDMKNTESLLDLLNKHEAALKKQRPKKDTKPKKIQMSDKPKSSMEKVMDEIAESDAPVESKPKTKTDSDPLFLGPLLAKTKDKDNKDKDKDKDKDKEPAIQKGGKVTGHKKIMVTSTLALDKNKRGLKFNI